jgi:hypothetical protein
MKTSFAPLLVVLALAGCAAEDDVDSSCAGDKCDGAGGDEPRYVLDVLSIEAIDTTSDFPSEPIQVKLWAEYLMYFGADPTPHGHLLVDETANPRFTWSSDRNILVGESPGSFTCVTPGEGYLYARDTQDPKAKFGNAKYASIRVLCISPR